MQPFDLSPVPGVTPVETVPFLSGVEPLQVQETVENHLKSLLIKHFDPRKADSIFTEEGEVRNLLSFLTPVAGVFC